MMMSPIVIRRLRPLLLCMIVAFGVTAPVKATTLNAGDVVFAQDGAGDGANNAIVKADPVTGNRTLISRPGVLGTGPDFGSLIIGLALDHAGNILVTGFGAGAVFKIDPATGNRTILSSDTVGVGPSLTPLNFITVAPNGNLYVTAQDRQSVVRINPLTGDRTVVSGPSVGTGPAFLYPSGLTLTNNGDFYVFDSNNVFFVNGVTGDRSIVTGGSVGSGPPFNGLGGDVQLLADGFLASADGAQIHRIDPSTGARSQLSGPLTGSGPQLVSIEALSKAPDGSLIATGIQNIYRVDPMTGDRTILTGSSFGTGPRVGLFREAVVVVPEPSTFGLMALGLGILAVLRRRRTPA